tara:strand:+ start:2118 stop:2501 length:384 start_codon:yes stop_codon:yes gene_type:complete
MGMKTWEVTINGPGTEEHEDWLKANHPKEPVEILTNDVLWDGKHNKLLTNNGSATCSCCNGKRFREANYTDYPIWVVPYDCVKGEKYVIASGKHRINKCIADGNSTIKAYVYTRSELESYGDYRSVS